jgi:hypothetical protein
MDSMKRPRVCVGLTLFVGLALAIALSACGSDSYAVIACVDSTKSTEDIRSEYIQDLEASAWDAASHYAPMYGATCGDHPGDSVKWAVELRFKDKDYDGELEESYLERLIREDRPELIGLTETGSSRGTPLGEILAVEASQCENVGGHCSIYLLTDGEWADGALIANGGIAADEQRRFVEKYSSQVEGLSGSKVYFGGVGLGTGMTTDEIAEAGKAAEALVRAGGGEVAAWGSSLSRDAVG